MIHFEYFGGPDMLDLVGLTNRRVLEATGTSRIPKDGVVLTLALGPRGRTFCMICLSMFRVSPERIGAAERT